MDYHDGQQVAGLTTLDVQVAIHLVQVVGKGASQGSYAVTRWTHPNWLISLLWKRLGERRWSGDNAC